MTDVVPNFGLLSAFVPRFPTGFKIFSKFEEQNIRFVDNYDFCSEIHTYLSAKKVEKVGDIIDVAFSKFFNTNQSTKTENWSI